MKTNTPLRSQHAEATTGFHVPVMLPEVMEKLAPKQFGIYADATLGGGGYSERMLASQSGSEVYGFETDPAAMDFATSRLRPFGERFHLVPENFATMRSSLAERKITQLDGIVYDLGISSHQIDTASIGLSYRVDAPLDMRLDPRLPRSAMEVVSEDSESELRQLLRRYGEEPRAGFIARNLVVARKSAPIRTTLELAAIASKGVREDERASVLARVFQAIRIEVNQELEHLESSLQQAIELLAPGARLVVVSYHSLEDRIVKERFRKEAAPQAEAGSLASLKEVVDWSKARLRILTSKPLRPSEEELEENPRSRSARLRAAERI